MKLLTILFAFILTACSTTVPVVAKFPDAPKSLKEKCLPLKKIEGEPVSIVDLNNIVIENYTLYHECSLKVDEWNEWHAKQKAIFEEIK